MIPEGLVGRERIKFLIANKREIVSMKKSVVKHTDVSTLPPVRAKVKADKGFAYSNDETAGKLIRTIVMNTYNWMDSQDDVHLDGIFSKSLQERGGNAPHLHDHEFKIAAKVGLPIQWSEKEIAWQTLGVDRPGTTMALLLESEIRKDLNKGIYKAYLNDQIDQHSVGMQYVKLALAVDDEDEQEEFALWSTLIDRIGNADAVKAQGYFFAVSEAKLFEGSAVLAGANELTPTLGNKSQPEVTTEKKPELVPLDMDRLVKSYM